MLSRPLDAILENVINLKLGVNLRFLLCMKALSLLAGEAADYGVLSEGKNISDRKTTGIEYKNRRGT
ncbi:hypothetical protein BSK63_23360 [Paenibacillus odorifer]|nr:hypothetical protein BSK63_23360 [Paenibacillus odorifer]